jgi:hypothetical protein
MLAFSLGFSGRINDISRVSIILLRKPGIFSETLIKICDILGKRGTHLKNHLLHRRAATHTYARALRPLTT